MWHILLGPASQTDGFSQPTAHYFWPQVHPFKLVTGLPNWAHLRQTPVSSVQLYHSLFLNGPNFLVQSVNSWHFIVGNQIWSSAVNMWQRADFSLLRSGRPLIQNAQNWKCLDPTPPHIHSLICGCWLVYIEISCRWDLRGNMTFFPVSYSPYPHNENHLSHEVSTGIFTTVTSYQPTEVLDSEALGIVEFQCLHCALLKDKPLYIAASSDWNSMCGSLNVIVAIIS